MSVVPLTVPPAQESVVTPAWLLPAESCTVMLGCLPVSAELLVAMSARTSLSS